jgi:hypothetical protein
MNFPERPICTGRHYCREHRHAPRLLKRDQHVDGAVLEDLEAADFAAELTTGLEVVDSHFVHDRHRPDSLGAQRCDRLVGDTLDER